MLVILVNITALAQQIEPVQFNTLEYWWDGNVEQSEKVTLQSYSEKDNIAFDIDASALSKGMHVLYYKISDNNHNCIIRKTKRASGAKRNVKNAKRNVLF